MTLEQALAATGPLVAVFEASAATERTLGVWSVLATPVRLATAVVPEAQRHALSAELAQRGVRLGRCDSRSPHFWCAEAQAFSLWSWSRLELDATFTEFRWADDRRLDPSNIREVVTFVENEMEHRGVRLELLDGSRAVVVDEHDPAAIADPTYNVDNLAVDAGWADLLGIDLAKWLRKPHLSQLRGGARLLPYENELRALGLDGAPALGESAEFDGERFEPNETLERLRTRLEFYQRELDAMSAFASKWGAPMDEVTDKDGDYREAAARLREAIARLEAYLR